MQNKKAKFCLLGLALLTAASVCAISPSITKGIGLNGFTSGKPDCGYLQANYTNLGDVNANAYDEYYVDQGDTTTVETWGTVTEDYLQGDFRSLVIQSGDYASTLYRVPKSDTAIGVGSFVTISGKPTYYNGLAQFDLSKAGNNYYIVEEYDSFDVENRVFSTSTQANNFASVSVPYGPIQCQLQNITIKSVNKSAGKAYFTFEDDSSTQFQIYDATGIIGFDAIFAKLEQARIANQKVTINAVSHPYIKNRETPSSITLQFSIYTIDDLTFEISTPVAPTSISLETTMEYDAMISSFSGIDTYQAEEDTEYYFKPVISPMEAAGCELEYIIEAEDLVYYEPIEDAARILENNKIYILESGSITITIRAVNYPSISYQCLIFATERTITEYTSFRFGEYNESITSETLNVDDELILSVYFEPSTIDTSNISYSSTDEDVAIITAISDDNRSVCVKAVGVGLATIIAEDTVANGYDVFNINVIGNDQENKTLNFSTSIGSYTTNFSEKTINGLRISAYRAGNSGESSWILYPSANLVSANPYSFPGSIANNDYCKDLTSISFNYKGSGTLYYGPNRDCEYSITLPTSASYATYSINTTNTPTLEGAGYWRVEASTTAKLYAKSISFEYTPGGTKPAYTYSKTADSRIAFNSYTGAKIPGETSVSVPVSVNKGSSTYTINSSKSYTYYTFDYVTTNSIDPASVALTDPVDICNYIMLYNEVPVNYCAKGTVDSTYVGNSGDATSVSNYFGDLARYVQQFTRTDGYATSVPYTGTPKYLELDFDSNGNYNFSGRDVSRIVYWATGFSCYNYAPVCLYTDDHYVTFREYLNDGTFGTAFDTKATSSVYFRSGREYDQNGSKTLTKKA